MAVITQKCKPTSPGRRFVVKNVDSELHKGSPYAPLLVKKTRCSGRNNQGRITVRHRGGGHQKHYRIIDFKRIKDDMPAVVERIEYDPNRTAHIALIRYSDGQRAYILAPKGLNKDDVVVSGSAVDIKPGKGAQMARSAGASVQYVAKDGIYAILRLRSGEMRKVLLECRASIGEVSNDKHALRRLGKAGAKRHLGIRPTVRGVAMNPVDHPHGGGEGKTAGGRHPVTPWGVPTKGYKTRSNKQSNKLIVQRRNKRK